MRNFAKIFAAVTTAALLCGCNGKSSEVDGTTISAEITPETMSAEEKITETEKQTEILKNTAAADSESVTEYGEYEYQPPREVLDAHFYSDNVEAVIECIPILDDKFRDVFNDREAIDGIYKAVTEVIPQEIADNIYSNIQTYEEYDSSEFRIKNVSYMKYDFNSDGTDDYYLYVDITDEIMSAMSNFHFTRVFVSDGDEFKPVEIPSAYNNPIEHRYILSTRTNGLKDILAFCNSNNPALKYDGISAYGGAEKLDDMHTFYYGDILPDNILHVNLRLASTPDPDGEYYTALNFADNPYMKNRLLYSSCPDGAPKAYNSSSFAFKDGYDFYIELNEDISVEFDLEKQWWMYDCFDLLEIKYIGKE